MLIPSANSRSKRIKTKLVNNSGRLCEGIRNVRVPHRLIIAMILVVAVFAVGFGVQYVPDLNWIAEREESLRSRIAMAPIACWFTGLGLYFCLSMIPGTAGKSIIFGWLFGFWAALFLVEIGLTAAAILSFLVGRYLVKHLIHRRWQIYLTWIDRRFAQDGAFYLLWLRLAHAPFTLINYGAGATTIPLPTFWWTTHVGILPASMVYVLVGSRIPSIRMVGDHGFWSIIDPPLIAILLAVGVLPAFVRPWLKRILSQN